MSSATADATTTAAGVARLRIAIVVSFLNEARLLPTFLDSLARQTRRPDELLLVDDGSSDSSPELAEAFAAEHPYARALRRPRRPPERDRLATAAEVVAFQWGVGQLTRRPDIVCKMDADLMLAPTLFAEIEHLMLDDPTIGVAGSYLRIEEPGLSRREYNPPDNVRGPNKFYRWSCYEEIRPLPAHLGWDTIDELRAKMRGWRVRSIELAEGDTVHLRPTGLHDGRLRAFRRWGTCAWCYGQHPLVALGGGLRRMAEPPFVLGGLSYVAGWVTAGLRGAPRVEADVREFVRRDKLREAFAHVRRPSRAIVRRT